MPGPSYPQETLDAYFQPMDPAWYADPVVGEALIWLARHDPDIIAAVADVDRSQIRRALALTPAERLSAALAIASSLEEFRRVER